MKLTEKLTKLKETVLVIEQILKIFPDIEIENRGDIDYYCSSTVTTTSEEVEFIFPLHQINDNHYAYIYHDCQFYIGKAPYSKRIYGIPLRINLFTNFMGRLQFDPYEESLNLIKATPTVIRKCHLHAVNYIQNNKVKIDKQNMPETLVKLLPFI